MNCSPVKFSDIHKGQLCRQAFLKIAALDLLYSLFSAQCVIKRKMFKETFAIVEFFCVYLKKANPMIHFEIQCAFSLMGCLS